jgi:hypothetical protein
MTPLRKRMIMKNGEEQEQEDTPNSSSEDVSMVSLDPEEEEGNGAALVVLEGEAAGTGDTSDETKRANRILETVSLWICHQIR